MTARARTLRRPLSPVARRRAFRLAPLARALGIALATSGLLGQAHAQKVFGPSWFAAKGAAQGQAATPGAQPGGALLPQPGAQERQSQAARDKLQTSIANLSQAAQAIAARQSAQLAARAAAQAAAGTVADGLAEGGLKVDTNSLTAGWIGAKGPTQSVADGRTTVRIEQTDSKAILNWETFNVGRQTTVKFEQQAGDAVLNRVNDPLARPSQIQGRIEAAGTVMVVNRNGIVFDGSSQVNTRNLAAAAVGLSDAQFNKGLYGDAQGQGRIPTFANELSTTATGFSHAAAEGQVIVKEGAKLQTHAPASVTEGGGYVMLLGGQVHNAGEIATPNGQAMLAAGDAFTIRKGMGTEENTTSTTRGNIVGTLRVQDSEAGLVRNTGLVQAGTGDITLAGHDVRQAGVLQATTSVHTRGTVHLQASGADARVTLEGGSTTAIVLDASASTALDVQRETLVQDSDKADAGTYHRRDQSLVQITSAGGVDFMGNSLTLATSGQVLVDAAGTSTVHAGARIDVAGYVGVKIAMDANNVQVNVQGFEQRDAPVNRDGDQLRNNNIWLDRRDLVLVPAGTNGAETDRWYTAGGLLEVGGYLGITGHGIGEWSAQGGTVQFSGANLVTRQGSSINLSGGTLDVQTGQIHQTWLQGVDGQLYNASNAPGDLLYTGLYQGFASVHARWGSTATEHFRNPLIAAPQRLENGYTVGRDGGRMVVATRAATLQGDIETASFQGERQTGAREAGLDGYRQAQTAAARNGELVIGNYTPVYDATTRDLRYTPGAVAEQITIGAAGSVPTPPQQDDATAQPSRIALDAQWLGGLELGALRAYATGSVAVDQALAVAPGGEIALHATQVDVRADLTARGGRIALGDVVERYISASQGWGQNTLVATPLADYVAGTQVGAGVTLDARGIWNNLQTDAAAIGGLPYVDGGSITLRSSGDVVVGAGALLDTSSGATLRADDSLAGGKGGNITLLADAYPLQSGSPGRLQLDGELRGHGVKGGGTLHLQTGNAVVLGGQLAGSDGTLAAGQASLVDLVTDAPFTIAAGAVLPVDYHFTRTHAAPGEALGGAPQVVIGDPSSWITVGAAWTPPKPTDQNQSYILVLSNGQWLTVNGYSWTTPPTVPAGSVITNIMSPANFPTGYVVSGDVFPNGMPIAPTAGVQKAGTVAASDLTYAAGSRIVAGSRLPQAVAVLPTLHLDAAQFQQGFSRYEVVGGGGLAVAGGADLQVAMPVLQAEPALLRGLATGGDPMSVLAPQLAPLFTEDAAAGRLTQRGGADLLLSTASSRNLGARTGPTLSVAETARVQVDPGRSITVRGSGQANIDGTLQAAGGSIAIGGLGQDASVDAANAQGHDGSVWIGERAVLDVSGVAHTALDAQGRRYGLVQDGGRIEIGGAYRDHATIAAAMDSFLIIRPGALLDASGASATLDLPGLGATQVGGDGGLVHLASFNGLYLDGDLRAAAGAAGAAGGTLSLALEAPNYPTASAADRVRVLRDLQLVQQQQPEALPADLRPGQADPALVYGHARIGVDRIEAGGFDKLSLLSNGMLTLGAGVDLTLGQSLHLASRSIAQAADAGEGDRARLSAPHVRLAGTTRIGRDNHVMPYLAATAWGTQGRVDVLENTQLLIEAGVLDVLNKVEFGAYGLAQTSDASLVSRKGFEQVELRSQGDLRFLLHTVSDRTQLVTEGDLVLAASQIYPATGARAEVIAGRHQVQDLYGNYAVAYDPERTLRVERIGGGAMPAVPYSAFGALSLYAADIDQGGVLRAPLGSVTLGFGLASPVNGQEPSRIVLRPGSITSASAAGLAMPYGGTVDGLTYNYNGRDVMYHGLGGAAGQVSLTADAVQVQAGAQLDLSGGGTLTGAGFLPGRGGSTDVRLNPLVQMAAGGGGFVLPGLATNPVYAIVPGVQQAAAPVAAENGAGDPVVGRQITVGTGVPGLPAGTYTLLPSTYALLPGAFRVELNGLAAGGAAFGETTQMRNGSYSTAARTGIARTDIADPQTLQAVVTPADTVRRYAQYNETSYAQFGLDWAAREGVPRPQLERDARQLSIMVNEQLEVAPGVANFKPAEGGRGGTVVLGGQRIEILADGAAATEGFDGVSVHAGMLNNLGAAGISIGGTPGSQFSSDGYTSAKNAWQVTLGSGSADEIIVRSGATLEAAQVVLVVSNREQGLIVEQGAGINTLGKGKAPWDSAEGFVLVPGATAVLALSNGWLDIMPSGNDESWGTKGAGYLHIGTCAADASCSGETRLFSEGTITAATNKAFLLDDAVRYGTRNLTLAMAAINVGSADALARAGADGVVPAGLTLNQGVLDRLLRGDTSTGAPALENLVLSARDAVNFYGSVDLSTLDASGKSSLKQLVLSTPAFYGYGDSSDVARIATDTLVWNGATTPAGDVIAGGAGTGRGRLVVDARQIEFGYGDKSQPNNVATHDRMALGFATVDLNASERITANHLGTLAVHQSQDGWDAAARAWRYSGGDLNITTPLLTGRAGSVNRISAGGSIAVTGVQGATAPSPGAAALADALGAELALDAGRGLALDTAVLLPSGKLTLTAQDDVQLAAGAQLDLAGRKIDFFDVRKYSWGGELVLDSRGGSVVQQAGGRIDLSAENNRAGRLTALASQGTVALAGAIAGGSSGQFDAGGTLVPFAAGYVDVRAQQIDDFAGLNARLTEGKVFGGRSFQLKQGDLVIGSELKAREINVSVDNGSLTVNGTVDASGAQAGSIRLAASDGLTLGAGAVLDASASVLRKDSYGQPIEAPNRAVVELDSGRGRLTLGSGARMDLSVDGAGTAYGTVALNAPRLGGGRGNDVDIDASGAVAITGAKSIAVNAFQRYDDAALGTDAAADGRSYQVIDQAYLDAKHADSAAFIGNALGNGALMEGKLAGLRGYTAQFRLRPGVEIASNAAVNPDGGLHVDGDLDLSGHRYASVNPASQRSTGVYGSGEAGALVLRAAGDLVLFGSISDGFDTSRLNATADDQGWVLPAGRMPFGGDLVVPHGGMATLDAGTTFAAGRTLNYALPVAGLDLPAGTALPVAMPLAQALALPAGTVLGAAVRDGNGAVLHAAGTVLREPVVLEAGTQLGAGFRLPVATQMAATAWPAGVPLPVAMTLSAPLLLAKGAIVPSETEVVLPGGAKMVNLRPADADGNQGRNLAIAPMLAAGTQSWDLRLVAGADLGAADTRLTLPHAQAPATLRLADTHFGMGADVQTVYQIKADVDPGFIELLGLYGVTLEAGQMLTPDVVQVLIDNYIVSRVEELDQFGFGAVIDPVSSTFTLGLARQQLYSVLRTGTGDLDLVAGGNVDMRSLFGVYTAGTASASLGPAYDQARGQLFDGTVLRPAGARFESLVDGGADSLYAAWYPEAGGNVLVRAGGNITGDLVGNNDSRTDFGYTFSNTRQQIASVAVGSWLWRQGSGSIASDDAAVPTAWWINFGTYVGGGANGAPDPYGSYLYGNDPFLVGFTGIGTLGGGNLTVQAGGNAGITDPRGQPTTWGGTVHTPRSQGLHLAVASSGRVTPQGTLVQTGGGDLDLRLGGTLNPDPVLRMDSHDLNSTFVNLRGATQIEAGAVGGVQLRYGQGDVMDSRSINPFVAGRALSTGGPILVLGDSGVRIDTRGDLVLGGVADPGRTALLNGTPFSYDGQHYAGNGWSWFSLWTPATAIDLFAAGGNLTPTTAWSEGGGQEDVRWAGPGRNQSGNGDGYFYPSILRAVAANGSMFYGQSASALTNSYGQTPLRYGDGVTLAPSPLGAQFTQATGKGELQLLAHGSIQASGFMLTTSTADPLGLPSPLRPGFVGVMAETGGGRIGNEPLLVYDAADVTLNQNTWIHGGYENTPGSEGGRTSTAPLFTFGTAATSAHAVPGQAPARYYALQGDIVGLRMGQEVLLGFPAGAAGSRYEASGPVAIRAGRDITDSGTPLGQEDTMAGTKSATGNTRGNLVAHAFADDISVVQAGRDLRNSSFYIVGPGLLDVSAGRDVYLADNGEFKSLGPVVNVRPGDRSSGAGISVSAGMGPGARWDAFAARYLDPENQADLELPFADQPGKVLQVYSGALTQAQWLRREFGYSGDEAGAPDFLAAKQRELDAVRQAALAEGRTAANRSLAREYRLAGQLHLVNWLTQRFGGEQPNGLGLTFDPAANDARAFFAALPPAQQQAYLRNVYYAELRAAGREYNDADGRRFGSYLRGREAIATLFPEQDADGKKIAYEGDLTMYSSALYFNADIVNGQPPVARPTVGRDYLTKAQWQALGSPMYNVSYYDVLDAGIHTNFGGDISIMVPGGRTLVGIDGGFNPGPGSGVMTQGEGDISIFAQGDILMGQSRIFTTFGGNILAWSAAGDINAGRGSKTTVVYTPQRRVYDSMGNVSLSPSTPNTGAGIATLNPVPEIAPGDIDLIAPLGTIDAGEAGIRVSGNVNLAAMQVLNAENIAVQGEAVGIPVVAAVNVAALTNASAAASQASVAAQEVVQRERAAARQALPSVFQVRVIGFGDQPAGGAAAPAGRPAPGAVSYDRTSPLQLVAVGASVDAGQARHLTAAQRAQLQRGE